MTILDCILDVKEMNSQFCSILNLLKALKGQWQK